MEKAKWICAFLAIALVVSYPCHAQEWAITYGGTAYDSAYCTQQTTDGGYIVAGGSLSYGMGSYDAWILKLDPDGTVNWEKTYGDSNGEIAHYIRQTRDGGYIVAGNTNSYTAWGVENNNFWVLKLYPDGSVDWQKIYGGRNHDSAYSIQQTADGGYIVAGSSASFGGDIGDFWILKLNSSGGIIWQKTYDGGDGDEHAKSIKQTTDGGYIVAGDTRSFRDKQDLWVLKLYPDGTIDWQKTYYSDNLNWGDRTSIEQTSDGGYVLAENGVGRIAKLHPDGTVDWVKIYNNVRVYSIQESSYGLTAVGESGDAVWILNIDLHGTFAWLNAFRDTIPGEGYARSIYPTSDNGYIVAGGIYLTGEPIEDNDFLVLKLNNNGEIPECSLISSYEPIITNISLVEQDTFIVAQDTLVEAIDSFAIPQDTEGEMSILCFNLVQNQPPVANAGPDQTVECADPTGTLVTLDGSGSSDPDNDIISFEWYEGEDPLGSGETMTYEFAFGAHTVTLVVTDSFEETDKDDVIISVQDTTPPEIDVSVSKDSLWPPFFQMVNVELDYTISDNCDEDPEVSIEVTSDEPTVRLPWIRRPRFAPDAEITETDEVLLRAERHLRGDGRVYMVTVSAIDALGNKSSSNIPVKVNRRKHKEAIDSGQNYDATEINR